MSALLAAIAETRRQQILQLVWSEERSAGDIAANTDVTFGAVSQHLRVLRTVGAVSVEKRGKHRFYRANQEALGPLARHLEATWQSQLLQLKALAEAEETKNG
jgi:DNA-binding transcriptional ArsR family regulator